MTTKPETTPEPEGSRHRELGPGPTRPAAVHQQESARVGLEPDEVPARFDALGRPVEAVRPNSIEAAAHWSEQLWHRR